MTLCCSVWNILLSNNLAVCLGLMVVLYAIHFVKVDSGVISVEYSAEQQSGGRLSVVDEVSYASQFIGI